MKMKLSFSLAKIRIILFKIVVQLEWKT